MFKHCIFVQRLQPQGVFARFNQHGQNFTKRPICILISAFAGYGPAHLFFPALGGLEQ